MRPILHAIRKEIESIVQRVPDRALRAIELAIYLEDAGIVLPAEVVDAEDADDAIEAMLRAAGTTD